jgi:hypothetical protein
VSVTTPNVASGKQREKSGFIKKTILYGTNTGKVGRRAGEGVVIEFDKLRWPGACARVEAIGFVADNHFTTLSGRMRGLA